jgi:hypothetical protein
LLPLRFNDGTPVPDAAVADTLIEFEEQFGAVSCETQTIRGRWRSDGQSYRDDLIRVFVDVADAPEPRVFRRGQGAPQGPVPATRHLDDDLPDRSAISPGR